MSANLFAVQDALYTVPTFEKERKLIVAALTNAWRNCNVWPFASIAQYADN